MQPWQPLITFWFGEETDDVTRAKRQAPLWWGKTATPTPCSPAASVIWPPQPPPASSPTGPTRRGRLALILLLDQLPRNIHRGTPTAFAQDAKARDLCLKGLSGGGSGAATAGAGLFYLPLEHAESREQQARSVTLFEGLAVEQADGPARETFAGFADFARRHQVIVERFGRFPTATPSWAARTR